MLSVIGKLLLLGGMLCALSACREQVLPVESAPPARPSLDRLKGKWLRPDGGYVLEIRNVAPAGKLDAGYFNPRSIHVAQAVASQENDTLKVVVELRDVNYPGSRYHLMYDRGTDRLTGTYFQAVSKETYDIFFQRGPP
jgi:hypothetical protein